MAGQETPWACPHVAKSRFQGAQMRPGVVLQLWEQVLQLAAEAQLEAVVPGQLVAVVPGQLEVAFAHDRQRVDLVLQAGRSVVH